jgi:hypothetical protein
MVVSYAIPCQSEQSKTGSMPALTRCGGSFPASSKLTPSASHGFRAGLRVVLARRGSEPGGGLQEAAPGKRFR